MGSSYKLDQSIPVQMPFFWKKKTFLWWWRLFLQVLEEVGQFVLSSCFSGYNSCLFSYGACGSGKTHIMFGTDKSQGLMSWICENLFKRASCYDDDTSFRAEIRYNFSFTGVDFMYMDWRKIYWIFFYGKVLTFQYICSLLLSVRKVSSWEMSAFISTTWYHDFFVDWLHSPYLYYSIEHCTVTISSHLGCKCAKGTGIQIYSIIKEKKAWRNMNFCTTIIMDIDPMDTLCWNL